MASCRSVVFSLSKALSDHQSWAINTFPAIVQRATACSQQWHLLEETRDEATGASIWRYNVDGGSNMDLIVDHITHELSDAVLVTESHTVREDCYFFGSMRRDRPELFADKAGSGETRAQNHKKESSS